MELHKIIFNHQFGFQRNKSTSLAIVDVYANLIHAVEETTYSYSVFLDFAKAFDTVDHNILLTKLDYYGIRGIALDWLHSYLKDRTQRVVVGGEFSDSLNITYGVPQGSVLGPLLCLIYINDIPKSTQYFDFHRFAVDTSLFMSDENLETLESKTNAELAKISDWLIANKLSLNTKKSNVLTIPPKNKTPNRSLDMFINNEKLAESQSVKYVGVLLNSKLSWKDHIQQTTLNMSKSIGILARIRHYAPKNILIHIYNAFITSYITYGITNWGGTYNTSLDPLRQCTKSAVRLITFQSRTTHSQPLFTELKLLCVNDCYKMECANFMRDINNNNLDDNFCSLFQLTRNRHDILTRQASSGFFVQPVIQTTIKHQSIINNGAKIWKQNTF